MVVQGKEGVTSSSRALAASTSRSGCTGFRTSQAPARRALLSTISPPSLPFWASTPNAIFLTLCLPPQALGQPSICLGSRRDGACRQNAQVCNAPPPRMYQHGGRIDCDCLHTMTRLRPCNPLCTAQLWAGDARAPYPRLSRHRNNLQPIG